MSAATPAVQDYLKGLWHLTSTRPSEFEGAVQTKDLAERLGVSAASATNMLKRLDSMGLAVHHPYKGAELTESGRKIALEVIRHHRLLETYLAEALGVPWDRVHAEAEILEHVLSEDLEDRIAEVLGDPSHDPHGHPIPSKDGTIPPHIGRPLWDAANGDEVVVRGVPDDRADALEYLAGIDIKPGARVTVIDRGPVGGPLFVTVGDASERHALSHELSAAVWVE